MEVLLQMLSSALVATQVDAGSAAQVPAVLAQLRNATDRGQLQASAPHSSSLHPNHRAGRHIQNGYPGYGE